VLQHMSPETSLLDFQRAREGRQGKDARCAPFALEVDTGVLPRKHAGTLIVSST
jgi:hypothetical protein